MREHGANNLYIELLEEYPYNDKEQLRAKEGEYIRSLSTLNKRIAGRTIEEWRRDNEEYLKEHLKSYYIKNKPKIQQYKLEYANINKTKIQEYKRQYAVKNKETIKEKSREYYKDNNDEIKANLNVKVRCECGEEITKSNLLRHQRSKKHQDALNTVSPETENTQTDVKTEERSKHKEKMAEYQKVYRIEN